MGHVHPGFNHTMLADGAEIHSSEFIHPVCYFYGCSGKSNLSLTKATNGCFRIPRVRCDLYSLRLMILVRVFFEDVLNPWLGKAKAQPSWVVSGYPSDTCPHDKRCLLICHSRSGGGGLFEGFRVDEWPHPSWSSFFVAKTCICCCFLFVKGGGDFFCLVLRGKPHGNQPFVGSLQNKPPFAFAIQLSAKP